MAVFSNADEISIDNSEVISDSISINATIRNCFLYEVFNNTQKAIVTCPSVAPIMLNGGCQIAGGGGPGDQDLTTNRPRTLSSWLCVTSDRKRYVRAVATCCSTL
ncbi:hypothetical protein [Zooshikella harenae]|uniref:Uncharacterized protein n=1 Tax=Zooshikella harenae TaxID=2827238 RepID=A0ABS5Z9V7_9GAMM|nr:hypothetical protein [Zooshikella harenae]MBU2710770.1 hypothetical protein [Zooshikella harenae]